MKHIYLILAVLLSVTTSIAQKINPNYDPELATKLGADDYGMKSYVFVILKTGKNQSTDKVLRDSCFAGHMNNINRLVKEKKLIIAGPMEKNEMTSCRKIFTPGPLCGTAENQATHQPRSSEPDAHASRRWPERNPPRSRSGTRC